ncbi:MAG: patatin-like phospholipase family protein [Bacteroidales bacterium]|jgi:NTE family protein|nr:patatin-like phospholipase family protein [Bacteroidales bacterium]
MNLISKVFQKPEAKKYAVGIALSGGGVRGFAHLGVLKALHEQGIEPEIISGTSAGALAGVFYADGYDPEESFEIFYHNSLFHFTHLSIPNKGLMSIEKMSKILKKNIRAKTFDDLKKPLYVAASNLNDGVVEYFHTGDIIEKVVASASIPVLFKPQIIGGKTFVDGGVFDNLPIQPIQDQCKKLIGSHVNPIGKEDNLDSMMKIAERTFHLTVGAHLKEKKALCDLFIESEELKKYGMLSLDKGHEIFEAGYKITKQILENNNPF